MNPSAAQGASLARLLLIPRAVGINLVGLLVALTLKLPIFLDTTGTFLAAVLLGPVPAMVVGASTNIIAAVSLDPISLPFGLVNMAVGLTVGLLARAGAFNRLSTALLAGLLAALVAASVASVIVVFLFGGVTTSGNMVITAVLVAVGKELYTAVFSSQIFSDTADKLVIALAVYWLIRNLPERTLRLFNSPVRVNRAA